MRVRRFVRSSIVRWCRPNACSKLPSTSRSCSETSTHMRLPRSRACRSASRENVSRRTCPLSYVSGSAICILCRQPIYEHTGAFIPTAKHRIVMKKTARAALLAFLVLCLVLFSAFYQYDDGVIGQFRARATGQQDAQLMQPVQQVVPQEITTGTSERIVYVYGTGMMVRKDSSGITYQHQDYLSSNRFASDANGRLVSKSVQEPYGSNIEEFGASVALQNDYTFTGKEQDDRLYYYGARYYDPQTARFVSVDHIPTRASPYAYAANNPLKFVDPTGAVEWALTQQADTTGVVVLPPDDGMSDVPRWEQGSEPDQYSLQREMARAGQPSIAGTPEGHFVAIETTIGLLTSLGGAGMAKA